MDFSLSVKDGWPETRSAKSVWVGRCLERGFTVFNSRCTHLGCIVGWKTKKNEPFSAHRWKGSAFYSPCQAGVFTIGGKVIGSPPRPLDTLEHELRDGDSFAATWTSRRAFWRRCLSEAGPPHIHRGGLVLQVAVFLSCGSSPSQLALRLRD